MDEDNICRDNIIDVKKIDVIPGIRVLAIFLIAWFHIWQQSWLTPYWITEYGTVDFMFLPRAGYLWVDMFILLSAYQLFLPYVTRMMDDKPFPSAREFYKKRIVRIMPSYYFCIIICLIIALSLGEYYDKTYMALDILTHLSFTHVFSMYTYMWTNLNVVLWTVGILVQFYLIFPLLVRAYRARPVASFGTMIAIAVVYRMIFVNGERYPGMFVNQLPAFFDVIALGFLVAYLTVYINRHISYQKYGKGFVILSILSFGWIGIFMRDLAGIIGQENIQRWQGQNRLVVAIAFSLILICTIYATRGYRKIFSNRVMIFLASVSYNYYIWHQYIAVRLRQLRFPPYVSEMPNVVAEKPWQYTYTIASFLIPLLVAIALTWAIDRQIVPAIVRLTKKRSKIQ